MEAVRIGDYWSENKAEVLSYIAQMFSDLLCDAKFLKKYSVKLNKENGLSKRLAVPQILAKCHEEAGYNVFLPADEAVYAKEAADRKAAGLDTNGPEDLDPAIYGELQEGLTEAAHAANGDCDPLGPDELLYLLEFSSRAGEVGAAVYCCERLEAVHDGGLPKEMLGRIFDFLKPLLRPGACRGEPRLTGPWSETPRGRAGAPNPRRSLGLLLTRLAKLRKDSELAAGGDAAAAAQRSAECEETLVRLCAALAPHLAADAEAGACRRRGALVPILSRICSDHELQVSTPVAWDLLRVLEETGAVHVEGRDLKLRCAGGGDSQTKRTLKDFAAALPRLDASARERLDRRKRRQKARQQGKAAKRRREGA